MISYITRPPTEKAVQAQICALYRLAGCRIYSTSQYRPSHVSVGIPDLLVRHPARGVSWWFEVKTYQPRGFSWNDRATWHPKPLAPAQVVFATEAIQCGERHYWGGLPAAEDALIDLGLAMRDDSGMIRIVRGRAV